MTLPISFFRQDTAAPLVKQRSNVVYNRKLRCNICQKKKTNDFPCQIAIFTLFGYFAPPRLLLRRPKQVHFCAGVVSKMNGKIWWVTSTHYPLFLSTSFRSRNVSQKSHFFNKAVQKGCLSTLPHQGLGGLVIQKSFLRENGAIYPHFGMRGLAIQPIGMCKRTPFHQYVVAVQCSCQCQ